MPYPVNKRMIERAAQELLRTFPGQLSTEEAMQVGERIVRAAALADQRDGGLEITVIPGQMTVDEVLALPDPSSEVLRDAAAALAGERR